MLDLVQAIARFEQSIHPGQVWMVLDVDRTVINTTSWYHACITPDLLMTPANVTKFLVLNEQAFGGDPVLSDQTFRERTLKLLKPMNRDGMYAAGYTVGGTLHSYQEPYRYLAHLRALYGDKLRVIYLTAGYEPFIQGVVDRVHETQGVSGVQYQVFGSGITFEAGDSNLLFICNREAKQQVVRAITDQTHVAFLADDDRTNSPLFEIVKAQNGKVLPVVHQGSEQVNQSWVAFLKTQLEQRPLLEELKHGDHGYALYAARDARESYPAVFEKFQYIDEVGIISLPRRQYADAHADLLARVTSATDRRTLANIFDKLVYVSNKRNYLRGKVYYHWLPPYVFVDARTKYEKWREQLEVSQKALKIIARHGVVLSWPHLSPSEKLLVLSLVDHCKDAIIHTLNALYFTSVKEPTAISDYILNHLDAVANKSADLYYGLLFDVPCSDVLNDLVATLDAEMLTRAMKRHQRNQQGMRELDDPHVITLSVLSLLAQMESRQRRYDCIIDFPCGGLELGLALIAIHKLIYPRRKLPDIVHCFYSSKKVKRQCDFPGYRENGGMLFDFTPHHYHKRLRAVLRPGQSVLLYDNNTATFNTLANIKAVFAEKYNMPADAAVAAVWYENIAADLLNKPKAERLWPNWSQVLDYQPVSEYISAFSTWGTSAKGRIIEAIYLQNQIAMTFKPVIPSNSPTAPIFKACRVHNAFDLTVALQHGANAIGIHAVFPDRNAYPKSQQRYGPIGPEPTPSDLPISTYECASIKAMQAYIPNYVKQVILFEQPLSMTAMQQSIAAYGLDLQELTVQLHHRLTTAYLRQVRKICPRIIAVIGASQADFASYFTYLQTKLDSTTDYVLVDLSKHQPDLIRDGIGIVDADAKELVTHIAPQMQHNRVPILLADDTSVASMKQYLQILTDHQVIVAGMDMQNALELPQHEQRYRLLADANHPYQIRIRKSSEALAEWRLFVRSKIFRDLKDIRDP